MTRAGLAVAVAALVALLVLAGRGARVAVTAGPGGLAAGRWVPLGDLPWEEASTGWLGVANQHGPRLDRSFAGGPLRLGFELYDRGIGTYPFSEITYRLDGAFSAFAAVAGLDDATPGGPDGVRFLVYADEVLRFETETLRPGDRPVPVELAIGGAQTLRLVVADDHPRGDRPLYADWAEPRVLQNFAGEPLADATWTARVRDETERRAAGRQEQDAALRARAEEHLVALRAGLPDAGVRVTEDGRGNLVLANAHVAAVLGLSGDGQGSLSLVDRRGRSVLVDRASPSVALGEGAEPVLLTARDSLPASHRVMPVEYRALGRGQQVIAVFPARSGRGEILLQVALFAESDTLLLQLVARGELADDRLRFAVLDPDAGAVALGEGFEYVTDFSRLRHAFVPDDGLWRRETVGPGKPVLLRGAPADRALVLAALDETRGPTRLAVRRQPGEVAARVGFSTGAVRLQDDPRERAGPRLLLDVPGTADLRRTHATFKRLSAELDPPAIVPEWARHQWISWYAFNVAVDEATLRAQVDYVAENLADLGPWHVLVDAGWAVAEGRDGADWRSVDREKFPSGLRALVDYAHAKGVRVVGYVSTPYVDSRRRPGDWLGMRRLIEQHPDWLVELGGDAERQSYAFDFANPEVQAYWHEVIRDLLVVYDMDGVKVDGLGNAEGALLAPDQVDAFGRVDLVSEPAMDIYRFFHRTATAFKHDAWIQAGWLTPTFANPYSHAFWYGDDYPAFSNPYPFPGLREKVDYATVQHRLLGQRSNMGNVYDGPDGSTINRWWLGAGLALGTQVALSFDLRALSPFALAEYRRLLVHARPFAGETRFGPGLYPDYFATTRDGTTYLGLINRDRERRSLSVSLADLGLRTGARYSGYDVEERRFLAVEGDPTIEVDGESFRLYILRREPGVLWTSSSWQIEPASNGLDVLVRGPPAVPGELDLAVARPPARVLVDGRPTTDWRYDADAGVLHVSYDHAADRRVEVRFD